MTSELERAAAFEEALWDACAERIVPSSLGTAVFNDTLHRVWSLNVLRVEKAGASAEEMAAEAERLQGQAGLLHRRVFVADSKMGRELEEPFTALGWKTDAFLFMVPSRAPNREVDLNAVVEVERETLAPLEEAIIRETLSEVDEETVHQIQEANRMVAEAGRARHFAVAVDGAVVSSADLYSDGTTAQIEDVGTLAEYRGHGYASAVVMRALAEARAAGHDFVFLVADARDWPKELYRRLGFEAAGEKYAYLLSPVAAG
jgi:ribosomal protein S18 acetylase RimI-like enzyme